MVTNTTKRSTLASYLRASPLEAGEQVHLEQMRLMSGLAQIRRPGDTARWWTYSEAVQ